MYNKSLENDNLYTQYNNIDGKLDLITLTVRGRQNTNAWRDVKNYYIGPLKKKTIYNYISLIYIY